jgi:septum site-determining protein MinC
MRVHRDAPQKYVISIRVLCRTLQVNRHMREQTVTIKGIKDGLLITLNPVEQWQVLMDELASHIDQKATFFAGARVTVDAGRRPIRKDELNALKVLLERRRLTLWTVLSDSDTTVQSANALDLRTSVGGIIPGQDDEEGTLVSSEESGTNGIMIKRTLRSGRTIHSQGHVLVFGDVNPGAEIVAAGDIVIWGRLRGNVHAGAYGDEKAVVCALDMSPTQLRIAGYIVTSPEEKRQHPRPEMALIRNGQIVVEAWK